MGAINQHPRWVGIISLLLIVLPAAIETWWSLASDKPLIPIVAQLTKKVWGPDVSVAWLTILTAPIGLALLLVVILQTRRLKAASFTGAIDMPGRITERGIPNEARVNSPKRIADARPYAEVIEWLWNGLQANSPYFEFVLLIVNPSGVDIRISGHTAPIRISEEPYGLLPQFPDVTVPYQDSRLIEIRQPLMPAQANDMLESRQNGNKVSIATNEFHLKFTSQDPLYPNSELLVGYKYDGAGGYRVIPGFSMKQ